MIITAGLTPAWQQILTIEGLRLGEVNRAKEAHWCASGKVLNAGLALHSLGAAAKTIALLGGIAGRSIDDEFKARGISHEWVWSAQPTRVCTTVLDPLSGVSTELVENAAPVSQEEIEEYKSVYGRLIPYARMVVMSGSLPAGAPTTFYRELMECTHCRAVLDVRGAELLQALPLKPFLVKPNREELGKTLGDDLRTDKDLRKAMMEIRRRGAEWVAVSQGKEALYLCGGTGVRIFQPPMVKTVNPIASGDCLAAGIAWAIDQGMSVPEAVKIGIGAAAQNASVLLPARIDPETARQLGSAVIELT